MKSGRAKFLSVATVISGLVFSLPAFADKTGSAEVDVEFTFGPYLSVDFSSDSLVIDNLIPGTLGQSAPTDITVQTNNLTGYIMFATVGDTTHNSNKLTNFASGSDSNYDFSMVSADTADASLEGKQWGYRKVTGSDTASGTWTASTTAFSGLPLYSASGYRDTISSSTIGPISHTIPFIIGAKADNAQPSGTYENVINFTVVANALPDSFACNPSATTISDAICMQDINTDVKNSMIAETQYQLTDARDEKTYWVAKLADGNVWMTQNLDLGGSSAINLDSTNTNLANGNTFTLPASGSWSNTYSAAKIYDPGDNYIPSGTGSATSATSLAADSEDLHYHQGNYYNWYAATAGSDASKMNDGDEAPQSICPKGWRLPYGTQADKSWHKLINNGVTNITASTITQSPVYIPRAGDYGGSVRDVGSYGGYWSSTAYGDDDGDYLAYLLYFESLHVSPQVYAYTYDGSPVRCVAL